MISAINNLASTIVTATTAAGSDGTALARPTVTTNLAGGADEAFPENEPMLINTSLAALPLGDAGTLPAAVRDAWRAAGRNGAKIIAVRVAAGADAATKTANIVGDRLAKKGIYALLNAESAVGVAPALIAATGFTDNFAAASALQAVANDINAVAIVDCPHDAANTAADAVAYARKFSNALCVYPEIRIFERGDYVNRPPSAIVAGHISRVDADEGWHHSPSNRRIFDIAGTTPPIDFAIDNPNSTANYLNQQFISTVVRRDNGLYFWGNRLANGRVITHYRVERIVATAVAEYVADWVDRNIDVPFIRFVLDKINDFLRDQTVRGVLTGGKAFFDPAKNTANSLAENRVTFSIQIGIANVAEHIIIEQQIVNVYNEQIITQVANNVV